MYFLLECQATCMHITKFLNISRGNKFEWINNLRRNSKSHFQLIASDEQTNANLDLCFNKANIWVKSLNQKYNISCVY